MAGIESKLRYDIASEADAASPLSPAATRVARYGAAVAMTVVATIVAVSVDSKVAIPNLSLVFVVPVIVAGVSLGLGPSLCSAVLGALAFNFFLTEPRYSLVVDDVANIWAIGLLFVIGVIASGVAFTSHRRAAEAALLTKQVDALHGYSNDLEAADSVKALLSITSRALAALFQVPAVVMLIDEGKVVLLEKAGDIETCESDLEIARSSLATGAAIRSGVYPNLASRFDFWPVATGGHDAVIGLAFDPEERPTKPDALVGVVARLLALMLHRQQASIHRSAPDER
jgi:K+-sensing histidine kinase KdpD